MKKKNVDKTGEGWSTFRAAVTTSEGNLEEIGSIDWTQIYRGKQAEIAEQAHALLYEWTFEMPSKKNCDEAWEEASKIIEEERNEMIERSIERSKEDC